MKTTINDVAKKAGVSIKTVSRVMNKEPSVRQATIDKVMEAVKELDYQPNFAARNLAGTKSYTIAFIYDNPNAYYVIDMQNGILAACREQGFELLIHPCNSRSDNLLDELSELVKHSRISGLVLTPPFSEQADVIDLFKQLDVEIVRIVSGRQDADNDDDCIVIDDFQASKDLTEHLVSQGHSSVAFIGGDKAHKSSDERLAGYKQAMQDAKLVINPNHIVEGDYSFESGVKGAQQLLNQDDKPTAIFACNDEMAAGSLFAARLMGVEIPQQLSIVGFEDSPFSRQTWPKLTTAHQPNNTIAKLAASVLLSKTRKLKDSSDSKTFVPSLVVRDSSGVIKT